MNIGKIFINNQSNNLRGNGTIDVILEDKHKLVFSPTENCKYRLFGSSSENGNFDSMIKDLDKTEIDLYLKYSLVNFASKNVVTKLVVYLSPDENNSTVDSTNDGEYDSFIKNNIILFIYKLNVLDTKYSLKYQQEFALVESEEIYELESFEIKYEDEFGNTVTHKKISNGVEYTDDEYSTISADEWNNAFIKNSFIPNNVTNIGIYTSSIDNIKLASLPINYTSYSDDKLYSIGIIGDIRWNYLMNSGTINFSNAWHSAATLYHKNNCEFVCSTGNIFFPNNGTKNAMHNIINKIGEENLPIYAAIGSYDNVILHSSGLDTNDLLQWFNAFAGGSEMNENKFFRCPNDNQSFYFLKEVNGAFNKFYDCYVFVSLDYDYYDYDVTPTSSVTPTPTVTPTVTPTSIATPISSITPGVTPTSSVTPTPSITTNTMGTTEKLPNGEKYDYRTYNPETINWLMKVLEVNKFHRTFIFTNLYFSAKAGNYHNGDKFSSVQIDDKRSNILAGSQYTILNELNNRYHNTIWFTGNSEYGFEWQRFDNEIIVCKNDYELDLNNNLYQRLNDDTDDKSKPVCTSAYNIHVPGFTNAQEVRNEYNNDTEHISSQSFIMNVYESYVELIGYIHKQRNDENFIDQKCPYACYKIDISGR